MQVKSATPAIGVGHPLLGWVLLSRGLRGKRVSVVSARLSQEEKHNCHTDTFDLQAHAPA